MQNVKVTLPQELPFFGKLVIKSNRSQYVVYNPVKKSIEHLDVSYHDVQVKGPKNDEWPVIRSTQDHYFYLQRNKCLIHITHDHNGVPIKDTTRCVMVDARYVHKWEGNYYYVG